MFMLGFIRTIHGAHPAGNLRLCKNALLHFCRYSAPICLLKTPRDLIERGSLVFSENKKSVLIFFQLHREFFLPLAHVELKSGLRLTAPRAAVAN